MNANAKQSPRLPLWKLELFREQALRRRNVTHAAYTQAQLELDDLDRQIKERREEERR